MCANNLNRNHDDFDSAVLTVHKTYSSFSYTPQNSQWTILASVFLTRRACPCPSNEVKVIGLATGTKCLPASRLSPRGEIVHDSHAEVLARRCALRWFLEEIRRIHTEEAFQSEWMKVEGPSRLDGLRYTLRDGVGLNLYVSTVPCGDASMRFLASTQDEEIASLKNSSVFPNLNSTAPSRGRDNYARLGVLRTKPGRADSPPTLCMSCSDKIARWNVLGVQGALGSCLLAPIYFSNVIIGEVPDDMREVVREDCERAFWKRVEGRIKGFRGGFSLHRPQVHFTSISFSHSRTVLSSSSSCVESLCWTSGSQRPEVLINGLKRGVSPKHRHRKKSRPLVSRIALFDLVGEVMAICGQQFNNRETYLGCKLRADDHQSAKVQLVGPDGPFAGWISTGAQWQIFTLDGEVEDLPPPAVAEVDK